jgi:hypothetical protein
MSALKNQPGHDVNKYGSMMLINSHNEKNALLLINIPYWTVIIYNSNGT